MAGDCLFFFLTRAWHRYPLVYSVFNFLLNMTSCDDFWNCFLFYYRHIFMNRMMALYFCSRLEVVL